MRAYVHAHMCIVYAGERNENGGRYSTGRVSGRHHGGPSTEARSECGTTQRRAAGGPRGMRPTLTHTHTLIRTLTPTLTQAYAERGPKQWGDVACIHVAAGG